MLCKLAFGQVIFFLPILVSCTGFSHPFKVGLCSSSGIFFFDMPQDDEIGWEAKGHPEIMMASRVVSSWN